MPGLTTTVASTATTQPVAASNQPPTGHKVWTLLLFISCSLVTATPADYVFRPVSITLFPLISTNGRDATRINSALSLNIIGGYQGRLTGVELGTAFNVELNDARGYQLAAGINVVSGSFYGAQQAGLISIVGRDLYALQQSAILSAVVGQLRGAQFAGGATITLDDGVGLQASGGASYCGGWLRGLQITGGASISRDLTGAQLAGGANITTSRIDGLQLAGGLNYCRELRGCQLGSVNITGQSRGVQLGLVNIADDVDVPIGLVSIIRLGQFHLNVWASEIAVVNIGLKTGSRRIYSTINLGLRPQRDSSLLLTGLGIGCHIPLGRFFLDLDGGASSAWRWPHWFQTTSAKDYGLFSTLRVTAGWQLGERIAISVGPTASVWLTTVSPSPFGQTVWPGFTIGLQLL